MNHCLTVLFAPEREYMFHLTAEDLVGLSSDEALAWLIGQFESLECEPRRSHGRQLLLDIILDVAREGGEAYFKSGDAWARAYARRVVVALGQEQVRMDVVARLVN